MSATRAPAARLPAARAYAVRAEFRRRDRGAPWVLAGVLVEGAFWPAAPGAEPVRQRLPHTGLLGWADLPSPVIAPSPAAAAAIGLAVSAARWPSRVGRPVPWSGSRNRA